MGCSWLAPPARRQRSRSPGAHGMNARTLHRLAFRLREARIVLAGLELAPMWLVLALALALAKPAAADTLTYAPPPCVSSGAQTEADLLPCFAPVVIAHGTESAHNRIGAPELARNWLGRLNARVDPSRAVLYTEVLRDSVADRPLLHLVYRMQFPSIPLRPSRHFFEAHRNPGLLLIVTLDA